MDAGHQGESGRYDSLKETALEYAFALDCVGLESVSISSNNYLAEKYSLQTKLKSPIRETNRFRDRICAHIGLKSVLS